LARGMTIAAALPRAGQTAPNRYAESNPRSRGAVGREPVGAHEFVLLTDARFVLKPDFDSFTVCFRRRDSA